MNRQPSSHSYPQFASQHPQQVPFSYPSQYSSAYQTSIARTIPQHLQQSTSRHQHPLHQQSSFFPNLAQGTPTSGLEQHQSQHAQQQAQFNALGHPQQQQQQPQQQQQQHQQPQAQQQTQRAQSFHAPSLVPSPQLQSVRNASIPTLPSPALQQRSESRDGPSTTGLNARAADEEDESEQENQEEEDGVLYPLPPPPERNYPSEAALEKAIHAWSLEHGYELVRRASKKNAKGLLYKRYFHCSKHGKIEARKKDADKERVRVNRKSNRTGCPMSLAAVSVDPHDPSGEWQIRHRKVHHNHPGVEAVKLAGHRRRARTSGVEKTVDGLFQLNTPTTEILKYLQTNHPDGLFTRTDVANMKIKWKKYGTCATGADDSTPKAPPVIPQPTVQPIACNSCRMKKTKCDRMRPICGTCTKSRATCLYGQDQQTHQNNARRESQMIQDADDTIMIPDTNGDAPIVNPLPPPIPSPKVARRPRASAAAPIAPPQPSPVEPSREMKLSLSSSSVEVLAYASCGNGDSYKAVPRLMSTVDWPDYQDAFLEAAMKENTWEVLTGAKQEPIAPPAHVPTEEWNEHIKQLAIYNRRNHVLLAAIRGSLGPALKPRFGAYTSAEKLWKALEETCSPSGSTRAFGRFRELLAITLESRGKNFGRYAQDLYGKWCEFNEASQMHATLFGGPAPPGVGHGEGEPAKNEAFNEGLICMLFLENLGADHARMAAEICRDHDICGLGSGPKVGFKALIELVRNNANLRARQGRI